MLQHMFFHLISRVFFFFCCCYSSFFSILFFINDTFTLHITWWASYRTVLCWCCCLVFFVLDILLSCFHFVIHTHSVSASIINLKIDYMILNCNRQHIHKNQLKWWIKAYIAYIVSLSVFSVSKTYIIIFFYYLSFDAIYTFTETQI